MAKSNYATKTDIRSVKSDIKKLDKDLGREILEMKVEVLGELKDMREEDAAHNFSHVRINDEIQDHEKRIKRLETAKI